MARYRFLFSVEGQGNGSFDTTAHNYFQARESFVEHVNTYFPSGTYVEITSTEKVAQS